MIRVLVADDHKVVRAGIAAVLATGPDIKVIAQASTGEDAVRLYREHRPDVVTMDLRMTGAGGLGAIGAICAEFPAARVLVLSSLESDEHVFRALQAGAAGYLLKDAEGEELIAAVRAIHAGRRYVPPPVAAILANRRQFEPLSARELDVLKLVAKGRSNRELGDALGITENTVKAYLKSIAAKLGTPDRTAAVMVAVERGLLFPEAARS